MIVFKSICYFGLDALCIIAKVHLILVDHYILGIFCKLKVFSVFFFLGFISGFYYASIAISIPVSSFIDL